jgi:hypothetical protein
MPFESYKKFVEFYALFRNFGSKFVVKMQEKALDGRQTLCFVCTDKL